MQKSRSNHAKKAEAIMQKKPKQSCKADITNSKFKTIETYRLLKHRIQEEDLITPVGTA